MERNEPGHIDEPPVSDALQIAHEDFQLRFDHSSKSISDRKDEYMPVTPPLQRRTTAITIDPNPTYLVYEAESVRSSTHAPTRASTFSSNTFSTLSTATSVASSHLLAEEPDEIDSSPVSIHARPQQQVGQQYEGAASLRNTATTVEIEHREDRPPQSEPSVHGETIHAPVPEPAIGNRVVSHSGGYQARGSTSGDISSTQQQSRVLSVHNDQYINVDEHRPENRSVLVMSSLNLSERESRVEKAIAVLEQAFPITVQRLRKIKAFGKQKLLRTSSNPDAFSDVAVSTLSTTRPTDNLRTNTGEPQDVDAGAGAGQQHSTAWGKRQLGHRDISGPLPRNVGKLPADGSDGHNGDDDHSDDSERYQGTSGPGSKKQKLNLRPFPCVYHHEEDPSLDATKHCRTKHEYVSQLEIHHGGHHGGNQHSFFYCGKCFMRFNNKEEKRLHNIPYACNREICVTVSCPNHGNILLETCTHNDGRKGNSQKAQWKHLFRMARPLDRVPDPSPDHFTGSDSTITVVSTGALHRRQEIINSAPFRFVVQPENDLPIPSGPSIGNSGRLSPTSLTHSVGQRSDVFHSLLAREAQMRPLARTLLDYALAGEDTIDYFTRQFLEASPSRLAHQVPARTPMELMLQSRVVQLELVVEQLVAWINSPHQRSDCSWRRLRRMAEAATAPLTIRDSFSPSTRLDFPSSPPSQHSHGSSAYHQSQNSSRPATMQAHIVPYEQSTAAGQAPEMRPRDTLTALPEDSNFVDQASLSVGVVCDYSGTQFATDEYAAAYMPWTQEDSAVAGPSQQAPSHEEPSDFNARFWNRGQM